MSTDTLKNSGWEGAGSRIQGVEFIVKNSFEMQSVITVGKLENKFTGILGGRTSGSTDRGEEPIDL